MMAGHDNNNNDINNDHHRRRPEGIYTGRWCRYDMAPSSVKVVDLLAVPNLTVGHVQSLIDRKGRNRYVFCPGGGGLRYWM